MREICHSCYSKSVWSPVDHVGSRLSSTVPLSLARDRSAIQAAMSETLKTKQNGKKGQREIGVKRTEDTSPTLDWPECGENKDIRGLQK